MLLSLILYVSIYDPNPESRMNVRAVCYSSLFGFVFVLSILYLYIKDALLPGAYSWEQHLTMNYLYVVVHRISLRKPHIAVSYTVHTSLSGFSWEKHQKMILCYKAFLAGLSPWLRLTAVEQRRWHRLPHLRSFVQRCAVTSKKENYSSTLLQCPKDQRDLIAACQPDNPCEVTSAPTSVRPWPTQKH